MEGFIANLDNLGDASNKGHRIVEMLKRRCLLEEGKYPQHVKMHDVIHDLAIYIASPPWEEGPKFMVKAGRGLNVPPPEAKWREYDKISLMKNEIVELSIAPECHNLVSLLMRKNPLTIVPCSFFELMPNLQVLDLSETSITSLMVSSSSLLNLRSLILRECNELTELPFLGQLKELQFLDISSSGIRSLPQEMQNMVKLKKLNMSYLFDFRTIPCNVISKLSSLEDLNMKMTEVSWGKGSELKVGTDVTLGEVAQLEWLTTLRISIKDFDCVQEDVFYQLWPKLKKFQILIGPFEGDYTRGNLMKQVCIYNGNNYPYGVKVMVSHAEGLCLASSDVKDVSEFVGVEKNLRMLHIEDCEKMKCILNWSDAGENALQNIEELELWGLPKLKKLFEGEVPDLCLLKLRKIDVVSCTKLKSLFSLETVKILDQLEELFLQECDELEEIIEGNESLPENLFPKLLFLSILNGRELRRIIDRATLALPSLKRLRIDGCPVLTLPERLDTPDWQSMSSGDARWNAHPQP